MCCYYFEQRWKSESTQDEEDVTGRCKTMKREKGAWDKMHKRERHEQEQEQERKDWMQREEERQRKTGRERSWDGKEHNMYEI